MANWYRKEKFTNMKEYVIKRIEGLPEWDKIPVMPIDHQRGENKDNVSAQAQICWDDFGLRVRLSATEKHIRKRLKGPYENVCRDSCLEFFLKPLADDPHYMNIELNPNCAIWLGYNTGKANMTRLIPFKYMDILTPIVTFTKTGWVITYTVPFAFLQTYYPTFQPKSGLEFTGNCYKCGVRTRHPHLLMWNPIPDGLSFHEPEHFGKLILE